MTDFALTGRTVPEWIGKTADSKPPAKVIDRLFLSQGGKCALTGRKMRPGDARHADHIKPLKDGGENRESNLQLLLRKHHRAKTSIENTQRAEGRRHQAKAFAKPKTSMRGGGFRRSEPQRSATRKIEKWSLI